MVLQNITKDVCFSLAAHRTVGNDKLRISTPAIIKEMGYGQLIDTFQTLFTKDKCLIVANASGPVDVQYIRKKAKDNVILALDGAADILKGVQCNPDIILGDFDSIEKVGIKNWGIEPSCCVEAKLPRGNNHVYFVPAPCQDFTDLDKALCLADIMGATSIEILSAIGCPENRLDHFFGNVSLLKSRFHRDLPIMIRTESQTLQYIQTGEYKIKGNKGEYWSSRRKDN